MADINTADAATDAPRAIYLKDYQPPAYWVSDVSLRFELSRQDTLVYSTLQITRNDAVADAGTPLVLHGSDLSLLSIQIDDEIVAEQDYRVTSDGLIIHRVPQSFTLSIANRIHPAANTALEGLYESGSMLCTQCEAEGFRRITYFLDRPDVMSRYQVTLIADKSTYPVLLANGNLIEAGDMTDGRHYAVWHDPSLKPSYLFAIVAGDLEYIEDRYTTLSGREVHLKLYTESENIHKTAHAMHSLKQSMQWDEQTYGREYDLDIYMIVAVNHFNMGAMENKGLNIFNASCVLASPQTATDDDFYNIQSIIGHEYFHNWSGNRVTCRDWFQLSLKEGFTVFRDQEFSSDLNSRGVKRIDDVNVLRIHQFAQDASPMAHPVRPDHYIEISNFYTVTVYNKGAEVVRMLCNLVGREGFRRGTDLYFSRHDGQAVTTDDFVRCIEDANNIDLTQFRRWYAQAGTPELHFKEDYDAASKTYTLNVQQTCADTPGQKDKQAFHIPLRIGLLDAQGNDMPLNLTEGELMNDVLAVKDSQHTFVFNNVTQKPVASLLRGFSAPVKVVKEVSEDELAFLLAHDSDDFNRWDAGQRLAMQILLKQIQAAQNAEPLPEPLELTQALRHAMHDESIDKALLARILVLPSESYLADQMDVVDVDAIYQARLFTRRYLARNLQESFLSLYYANHHQVDYVFNSDEMARRALLNVCLSYLMETERDDMQQLCFVQFNTANNMTEQLAALSALAQYNIPQREQALAGFYQQWHTDKQVLDKWFAIQATSRLESTLTTVRELLQHAAFSIKNPNNVRAVVARFCMGNPIRFHAKDGSGYAFLTEQVLTLDKMNPQITARLVQAMSRWRRYDSARQELMQQCLQRILQADGLSKDTFEVVSRSLG